MKLVKAGLAILVVFLLAACSAQVNTALPASESQTPVITTSAPASSPTVEPTETPKTTPSPTASMTDLIFEAKWWKTAQFPVADEEAIKANMGEDAVEGWKQSPNILFHVGPDTDKEISIFVPYDGAVLIGTIGDLVLIKFVKLNGEWDGEWDAGKFTEEKCFPVFVSAGKIKAAEGITPDGTAVKKGQIVGYLEPFDGITSKYIKNYEGTGMEISTMYGTDIYKSATSPYGFLSEYLGINQP